MPAKTLYTLKHLLILLFAVVVLSGCYRKIHPFPHIRVNQKAHHVHTRMSLKAEEMDSVFIKIIVNRDTVVIHQ